MTEGKNFAGQATPGIVDTEYRNCNFTYHEPVDGTGDDAGKKRGVRLFPGDDTARTFVDCNLCNREVPPGSTVTGGLTVIKDFSLVTSTEEIEIDGETIEIDHHSDRIYGRWLPDGYDDLQTPTDIEVD